MLAFAAENFDSGEFLSDPRYVRWVMVYAEKKKGILTSSYYLMHKCSEKEFARFEPPENDLTAEKV